MPRTKAVLTLVGESVVEDQRVDMLTERQELLSHLEAKTKLWMERAGRRRIPWRIHPEVDAGESLLSAMEVYLGGEVDLAEHHKAYEMVKERLEATERMPMNAWQKEFAVCVELARMALTLWGWMLEDAE